MVAFLTILTIAFVAWRYRKMLGLDKTWDRYGREQADDLAARMGWRGRNGPTSTTAGAGRPATPQVLPRRSFLPQIDSSRLPAALTVGAVEAVVIVGLEIQGFSFFSSIVALLVGPFIGGAYLRSRWWMVVAAMIAVVVGAGGRLSPFIVALPVAAMAYAGIRADVRAWISRWDAANKR